MKITKYLSILALGLLVFSSCSDDEEDENPQEQVACETPSQDEGEVNSYLLGTWEWVETRYVTRTGEVVENPDNTSQTRALVFELGNIVEETIGGQKELFTYRVDTSIDTQRLNLIFLNSNGDIAKRFEIEACPDNLKITNILSSQMEASIYKKK